MGVSYSVVSLNPHARAWLDEIEYAYDQQVPSRDPTFDDVQKIEKHFQGFEIQLGADIHGLLFSVEYEKDGLRRALGGVPQMMDTVPQESFLNRIWNLLSRSLGD